jgi:hypothetical protein
VNRLILLNASYRPLSKVAVKEVKEEIACSQMFFHGYIIADTMKKSIENKRAWPIWRPSPVFFRDQ